MEPTVQEVGGEGALVSVLYLLWLLVFTLMLLIPALMLLLLLWVLHSLAPCLVATCMIIHHGIGARYVDASPAASPLLKTLTVLLLITSLLLILLPLLGGLRLCLPLLCLCRLLCLPLILGGQRWPADITVMVTLHYLLRLHV